MNIKDWSDFYDSQGYLFDYEKQAYDSNNKVLLPGRFYILIYKPTTKEEFNQRPVILSLGISKKDPESFLCIDLCMIPKKVRQEFINIYFQLFEKQINEEIKKCNKLKDADKQQQIKEMNYKNLMRFGERFGVKYALKRYKIKNTKKIYSLLFEDVYKVIGDMCDINMYVNTDIKSVQMEFIQKMMKSK